MRMPASSDSVLALTLFRADIRSWFEVGAGRPAWQEGGTFVWWEDEGQVVAAGKPTGQRS